MWTRWGGSASSVDAALVQRQQASIDVIERAGELPRRVAAADGFIPGSTGHRGRGGRYRAAEPAGGGRPVTESVPSIDSLHQSSVG